MKKSVGFVIAIISVAVVSCGDNDPFSENFKGVRTLGTLELRLEGGAAGVFDNVSWTLSLVDAQPTGDLEVLDVDIVNGGHEDYRNHDVLIMDSGSPSFAKATRWLTDGENGQVLLKQGALGRVTDILITSERALIDISSRDKPDFAGSEITALKWSLVYASLASPGTDPRGDGVWTDFDVRGNVVVEGRPYR